jgi:DNA-binding FrmR family transcriptional regulator
MTPFRGVGGPRSGLLDQRDGKECTGGILNTQYVLPGLERALSTAGGVACPRLLNELAAAQEALSQVAHGVGRFHVSSCVQSAEPHAEISQMLELIDIFDRFLV